MNVCPKQRRNGRETAWLLALCVGALAACSHAGKTAKGQPQAADLNLSQTPAQTNSRLQVCAKAGREKSVAEKAYMHAKGQYLTSTQAVSTKEMEATWRLLAKVSRAMENWHRAHVFWNAAALNFVKAEAASIKANAAYFKAANAREEMQTAAKKSQRADAAAQNASQQYLKARKTISALEVDASWIVWRGALEKMAVLSKGHSSWNAMMMAFLEAKEAYFEAQELRDKACQ